jgi:hypothetical protein
MSAFHAQDVLIFCGWRKEEGVEPSIPRKRDDAVLKTGRATGPVPPPFRQATLGHGAGRRNVGSTTRRLDDTSARRVRGSV